MKPCLVHKNSITSDEELPNLNITFSSSCNDSTTTIDTINIQNSSSSSVRQGILKQSSIETSGNEDNGATPTLKNKKSVKSNIPLLTKSSYKKSLSTTVFIYEYYL
jgi:hypothetical protein